MAHLGSYGGVRERSEEEKMIRKGGEVPGFIGLVYSTPLGGA